MAVLEMEIMGKESMNGHSLFTSQPATVMNVIAARVASKTRKPFAPSADRAYRGVGGRLQVP
jgi:hypothetical protein